MNKRLFLKIVLVILFALFFFWLLNVFCLSRVEYLEGDTGGYMIIIGP